MKYYWRLTLIFYSYSQFHNISLVIILIYIMIVFWYISYFDYQTRDLINVSIGINMLHIRTFNENVRISQIFSLPFD